MKSYLTVYLNSGENNVSKSLKCLGLVLFGKTEQVLNLGQFTIAEDVLEIALEVAQTDEVKEFLNSLPKETVNVDETLLTICQLSLAENEPKL